MCQKVDLLVGLTNLDLVTRPVDCDIYSAAGMQNWGLTLFLVSLGGIWVSCCTSIRLSGVSGHQNTKTSVKKTSVDQLEMVASNIPVIMLTVRAVDGLFNQYNQLCVPV